MSLLGAVLLLLLVGLALSGVLTFRFRGLDCPGRPSSTAVGSKWTHRLSGTVLLPGFRSSTFFRPSSDDPGNPRLVYCEVLESTRTHEPVFRCSCRVKDDEEVVEVGSSASHVVGKFFERLGVVVKRKKSGPEFFGITRADVQRALTAAANNQPHPAGACTCEIRVAYPEEDGACNAEASIKFRKNSQVVWGGLVCPGAPVVLPHVTGTGVEGDGDQDPFNTIMISASSWQTHHGHGSVQWQPGYHAQRIIQVKVEDEREEGGDCTALKLITVDCRVVETPGRAVDGPTFRLEYHGPDIEGGIIESQYSSVAVKELFERLNIQMSHHYSGVEFFGLHLPSVAQRLTSTRGEQTHRRHEGHLSSIVGARSIARVPGQGVWREVHNVIRRNAGLASSLNPRFRQRRFHLTERAVSILVGEDFSTFITYLGAHHPEMLCNGISESPQMLRRLETMLHARPVPIVLNVHESAEIIMAGGLSQRSYKAVKKVLKKKSVLLARHETVSRYIKSLDVGTILQRKHYCNFSAPLRHDCLCVSTDIKETLRMLLQTKSMYEIMEFYDSDKQRLLFSNLKELDPDLFSNLRVDCRTIFVRQTGDNYRSFRLPTQQMSFAVMNVRKLVGSPFGQHLCCLWRGDETRAYLEGHCTGLYEDLTDLAKKGIDSCHWGSEQQEHFNVVVLYVADLHHLMPVFGRAGLTAKYGCWRCKKPQKEWSATPSVAAETLKVTEMAEHGKTALAKLGKDPTEERLKAKYSSFHHDHFGQVAPLLFSALVQQTMPPCALHLILSVHRVFWKMIHSLTKTRQQEEKVVGALRKIGCHYLAFQMDSYRKSKGKYYDGSNSMRMTGNDCKRLEAGSAQFVRYFLDEGETFNSNISATKLHQLLELLEIWKEIGHDLRSTTTTAARVASFKERVEQFFMLLKCTFPTECSEKMVYMHILRDHVPGIMQFWYDMLGWGYGMFSTTAGEHLNKRLKCYEADHTSQGSDRFKKITHMFRVGVMHFPLSVSLESRSKVTCSACGASGHTKKNKICPNHVDQLPIVFPDSDGEL